MRVYYVGPPGGPFSEFEALMRGKRVLYSFATCRGTPLPEDRAGYCLDSGAFTTWKNGREVDMDQLLAWYERHDTADFKLALDVIGGTEAQQRENLWIMESAGQSVVPIFHGPNAESWRWFDELCERYPLVAIGSLMPDNTSDSVTRWLRQIFDRICDPQSGLPRVRIHGLRLCTRMSEFPFHSVDGSTWITAAKNGRMPTKGGRQTYAPEGFSSRDLQELWVKAWELQPK